jgi:predicted transposase/invertase (TIGR01784 family)
MVRLNPLNDYLIVKMFGETGDEEQLLSLMNAVGSKTGKCFASVQILKNKTLTAAVIGNKKIILDVRSIADAKARFDMEVQMRNQGNMIRRSLHYWSSDFRQGIGEGEDYRDLPDVIAVNIINFPYIGLDEVHTSFHIYEDGHREYKLTDALELHFIDMTRFRKLAGKNKDDPLHRWLLFLDQDTEPEVLKEVLTMDGAIQKAQDRMDFVSMDRDAYREYELREAQMAFYDQDVKSAARKRDIEIARNGKAMGLSIEQISLLTGLNPEEAEKL